MNRILNILAQMEKSPRPDIAQISYGTQKRYQLVTVFDWKLINNMKLRILTDQI